MQVWTNSGITEGGKSYCDNFAFGDKDKCVISYGTVLLAVLVFLLWLVAAAIAVFHLLFYRRNGYLPNSRPSISNPSVIEPKFSVSTGTTSVQTSRAGSGPRPSLALGGDPNHPQRDVEKGIPAGFTHTDTPLGTHPGRKVSYGNSPPLTAPSRFDAGAIRGGGYGGMPQFRNISYRRAVPGGANETTPLSPGMPAPQTARNAPRLQVWAPDQNGPTLPRSPRADYGAMAANGPVTADVRRLPGGTMGFWEEKTTQNGRGFAYDANRRPSAVRTAGAVAAAQHAAGYSTAHNTPLPTPLGGMANPWGRN